MRKIILKLTSNWNFNFPLVIMILFIVINSEIEAQEYAIVLKNGAIHKTIFQPEVKQGLFQYSLDYSNYDPKVSLDELKCYYTSSNEYIWVPIEDNVRQLVATGTISVFNTLSCNYVPDYGSGCSTNYYLKKEDKFVHVFTTNRIIFKSKKARENFISLFKDDEKIYEVVSHPEFDYNLDNIWKYINFYNLEHPALVNQYASDKKGEIVFYSRDKKTGNGCIVELDTLSYSFYNDTIEEFLFPENESHYTYMNNFQIKSILSTQYYTKYFEIFADEMTKKCKIEWRPEKKASRVIKKMNKSRSQ